MATAPTTETPAGPSAIHTLVHFLRGGLLGGIIGLAFAALLFCLLAVGFLYAGQTVHGAEQQNIVIPQVPQLTLTPPITAVDLEPPEGKQEGFDAAHLEACWRLVLQAVEIQTTWWTLVSWAAVAGAFGFAVGLIGAILQLLLGHYWSPMFGVLALLAALAGIGLFVAHDHFQFSLPMELDAQGRLLVYTAVATVSLWWISIAGFRFRALLYVVATVLVGELLPHGLPPDQWTTTALWHFSVFLFVPTGYAWLAVERGQTKNII